MNTFSLETITENKNFLRIFFFSFCPFLSEAFAGFISILQTKLQASK